MFIEVRDFYTVLQLKSPASFVILGLSSMLNVGTWCQFHTGKPTSAHFKWLFKLKGFKLILHKIRQICLDGKKYSLTTDKNYSLILQLTSVSRPKSLYKIWNLECTQTGPFKWLEIGLRNIVL